MKPSSTNIPNYVPALRFGWLTGLYDKLIAATMPEKAFKAALVRQAGIRPGDRVLDFGTGTATLSILVKETHPGSLVTGVDVDEKVLGIARRKVLESGIDVRLVRYDGETLPFGRGSFERAVSSLVLHHLTRSQRQQALRELNRVLAPGGEIHIADWGKPANSLQRLLFYLVQLLDGFETTADSVRGNLPELLYEAGFDNVEETGCFKTVFGTLRLWRCTKW
ncbi:MAG: class I SAM-dependent methyltransferase [Saprospiraceae bacterium]